MFAWAAPANANISDTKATNTSNCPITSIRRGCAAFDSGTNRAVSTMADLDVDWEAIDQAMQASWTPEQRDRLAQFQECEARWDEQSATIVATFERLVGGDNAPVIRGYVIAAADVEGPFAAAVKSSSHSPKEELTTSTLFSSFTWE